MTNSENFVDELIDLKMRYFGSQYFSIKNWIMFNQIKLPGSLKPEDIEDWANEKQYFLAEQKVQINNIKSAYEKMLIDRLDAASALQERINNLLMSAMESKDAANIAKSLKTVAELQDEAMKLLKVDAFRNDLYERNKTSTEDLLKEKSKVLPIEYVNLWNGMKSA